jgi:hypothetical protein
VHGKVFAILHVVLFLGAEMETFSLAERKILLSLEMVQDLTLKSLIDLMDRIFVPSSTADEFKAGYESLVRRHLVKEVDDRLFITCDGIRHAAEIKGTVDIRGSHDKSA